MENTILYKKFCFIHLQFQKYHYTDNRNGSPMNYLAYMRKGNAKIVSKKKTIMIKEGDVFFIPRNLPYQSYWYSENEISFHSYGFLTLETCEKTDFDLQVIPCPEKLTAQIAAIPTEGSQLKCETLSIFYHVLSKLMPYMHHSFPSKKEEIIDRVQNFILNNPTCKISDAAKECYISEPYLYALFKEKTDGTPNDFRLKVLCQKGIEYLIATDKTVEEISSLIGLSSASHLRKILKKYIDATPREIRKNSDL